MKTTLIALFAVIGSWAFSQKTIELSLDQYHPRIGDPVTITFSLEFISEVVDEQMSSLKDDLEEVDGFKFGHSMTSEFSKVVIFSTAGEHTIGPFSFDFNGKQYVTNTTTVNVSESLPFEPGIWIRLVEEEGTPHLIIEQVIDGIKPTKHQSSQDYFAAGQGNSKYFDLKELIKDGVTFSTRYTVTKPVYENGDDFFGDLGKSLSYRYHKYEISFSDTSSGTKLTKKDFLNIPKKTKIEDIVIQP